MLDNAAAGRSMIELMLAQGLQVFSISWRNTGEEQGHFDLDTYARGARGARRRGRDRAPATAGMRLAVAEEIHAFLDA